MKVLIRARSPVADTKVGARLSARSTLVFASVRRPIVDDAVPSVNCAHGLLGAAFTARPASSRAMVKDPRTSSVQSHQPFSIWLNAARHRVGGSSGDRLIA